MARRYGIGTADITLYLIGGVARLKRMPRAAGPELLIALAGPAVNFAIVLALLSLTSLADVVGIPYPSEFVSWVLSINLGLGLFNLLPIFPMDGGRVLRGCLSGPLGRVRATEIAATLGRVIAVVGAALPDVAEFSGGHPRRLRLHRGVDGASTSPERGPAEWNPRGIRERPTASRRIPMGHPRRWRLAAGSHHGQRPRAGPLMN